MHARRYQTVVSLLDSLVEVRMLHEASIDEEALCYTFFPCCLRFGHKARDATHRRIDTDRQQFLSVAPSVDIGDALTQRACPQIHQFLSVAMECEVDVGIDQYDAFEGRQDVVQLSSVGFKELTTRRDIEEKIADQEITAYRTGTGFLTTREPAMIRQVPTSSDCRRVRTSTCDTATIDGNASPRKPIV